MFECLMEFYEMIMFFERFVFFNFVVFDYDVWLNNDFEMYIGIWIDDFVIMVISVVEYDVFLWIEMLVIYCLCWRWDCENDCMMCECGDWRVCGFWGLIC